jgi:hypothetical protein
MTAVFTVPCVFELPHFSFNASQANQLRAQHALTRCVCAAMNVPLEASFGTVRVVFVSRSGEHTDRDLVRRAVDTAVAALLPPVDPALVSTAFESAPERAPAGTGGVQQTLTIDIDVAATKWKAPQFSVCGRVFYFNMHESSDGGSERVCAGIGEYGWSTAQEQLGALLKAAGKRRRHAFTSEAWNAAADAVRTLYPHKGNKDVLLEPSGIAIPGAAVVGFCARYLYIAVRADETAAGSNGGVRFHVVAKAPHGGDVDSWRDSDAASASSLLRSPPTAWLSFADASLRAGGGSGGASTSSPPQWFRTPEHVARVDLVAHRVVREGASRFQLEDCYAACFLSGSGNDDDCATVARLTETLELLFRRSTEELDVQMKREGRSTARGKVLKHLSEPAFVFPFTNSKARKSAEAFVERLFCAVTGLPAGGSNVRTLSAFAAPQQQQQQQQQNPRQQQNSSSSSSDDDDDEPAVTQQNGPQRAKLLQPEETQFVEFKQQLHRWQNDDDAADDGAAANKSGGGKQHQSHANTERARRILAAFANTKGGVLFVGVSDAGELVGIPDSVKDALPRSTGFIPGMDSQAGVVHVRIQLQGHPRTFSSANLLAIHTPGSAAGPGGDSVLRNFAPGAQRGQQQQSQQPSQQQHQHQVQPEAGRPSPMVGQWWVRGGFAPAAAPAANIPQPKSVITQAGTRRQLTPPPAERDPLSQQSQLTSQMPLMTTLGFTPPAPLTQQGSATQLQQQAVEETRSVHAMRVLRGAAPFYCTPGMAAPPVRGQASTLALSVVSMTERIAQFLLQNAAEYPLPPAAAPTATAAAAAAVGAGARRNRDE